MIVLLSTGGMFGLVLLGSFILNLVHKTLCPTLCLTETWPLSRSKSLNRWANIPIVGCIILTVDHEDCTKMSFVTSFCEVNTCLYIKCSVWCLGNLGS